MKTETDALPFSLIRGGGCWSRRDHLKGGLDHKRGVPSTGSSLAQLSELSGNEQFLLLLYGQVTQSQLSQLGRGEVLGGTHGCEEGTRVAENRCGATTRGVDAYLGGDNLNLNSARVGVGGAVGTFTDCGSNRGRVGGIV